MFLFNYINYFIMFLLHLNYFTINESILENIYDYILYFEIKSEGISEYNIYLKLNLCLPN